MKSASKSPKSELISRISNVEKVLEKLVNLIEGNPSGSIAEGSLSVQKEDAWLFRNPNSAPSGEILNAETETDVDPGKRKPRAEPVSIGTKRNKPYSQDHHVRICEIQGTMHVDSPCKQSEYFVVKIPDKLLPKIENGGGFYDVRGYVIPNPPKAPNTIYTRLSKYIKDTMKDKDPHISHNDISKEIQRRWSGFQEETNELKQQILKEYTEDKKRYEREVEEYENLYPFFKLLKRKHLNKRLKNQKVILEILGFMNEDEHTQSLISPPASGEELETEAFMSLDVDTEKEVPPRQINESTPAPTTPIKTSLPVSVEPKSFVKYNKNGSISKRRGRKPKHLKIAAEGGAPIHEKLVKKKTRSTEKESSSPFKPDMSDILASKALMELFANSRKSLQNQQPPRDSENDLSFELVTVSNEKSKLSFLSQSNAIDQSIPVMGQEALLMDEIDDLVPEMIY